MPEGRALIQQIFPDHVSRITDEMSALGAGEQEELQRLLKKLGRGGSGR
jgi:MarR family 2-MHQ and catechol resistance regulon transcriptional repressor